MRKGKRQNKRVSRHLGQWEASWSVGSWAEGWVLEGREGAEEWLLVLGKGNFMGQLAFWEQSIIGGQQVLRDELSIPELLRVEVCCGGPGSGARTWSPIRIPKTHLYFWDSCGQRWRNLPFPVDIWDCLEIKCKCWPHFLTWCGAQCLWGESLEFGGRAWAGSWGGFKSVWLGLLWACGLFPVLSGLCWFQV